MAKANRERFLEMVQKSKLVEHDRLAKALAEIKQGASAEEIENSEFLAEKLIQAGLLTRWQCDKLLDGRHKGFFLGKYKLLGHLGTGGMSSVYRAHDQLLDRKVALKVLHQQYGDDAEYVEPGGHQGAAAKPGRRLFLPGPLPSRSPGRRRPRPPKHRPGL